MIKIVSNGKELKRELEELENEYNQGNLSKKEYFARKRDLGQEMETLQAAEHVRRMQGRMGSEKSLDYWSDQEEEKKKLADQAEKEEMFKKYITNPDSITAKSKSKNMPRREWFGKKAKIGLLAFVIVAFVVGTSMGTMLFPKPSETPQVSMMVNSSAFLPTPVNTTNTSNVSTTKYTQTTNTQTTTSTATDTADNSASTPTDTQQDNSAANTATTPTTTNPP